MKKLFIAILLLTLWPEMTFAQPVSADITYNITKNLSVAFAAQDFADKFTASAPLSGIKLSSIPDTSVGSLQLSGSIVAENAEIPADQIASLLFTPANDYVGSVEMQWQGTDGTEYSETPAKITIVITEPEEEPLPSIYADMAGHWGEYTSVKLFSENLWVGEKIGDKRYFRPDVPISRIDFLLTLLSAMGKNFDVLESTDVIFADEEGLHPWVKTPAKWAYQKGYINGSLIDGKIYLNPYSNISRAEAAKIISNALALSQPTEDQSEDFADLTNIPEWAVSAIRSLRGYQVIQGFEDNTFRPFDTITRMQAGEMMWQLYLLVNNQPQTDKIE